MMEGDRFTQGKNAAGLCSGVAVLLSALLVSTSVAAAPRDWRHGFESASLTDKHAGQVEVMVVGAGTRSQALAHATRALRDVYAASGTASLVMDDPEAARPA